MNKKHGLSNHKGYHIWRMIKKRCYDKTNKHYKNYGARGIILADEWIDDVKLFIDYINNLPHAFENKLSLDRINNNGNYEPGNLRWTTRDVQTNNSRYGFTGASKYKGVTKPKNSKMWQAAVVIKNKRYYIGIFNTELEAAIAYDNKCIELNATSKILNQTMYPNDFKNKSILFNDDIKVTIKQSTIKQKIFKIPLDKLQKLEDFLNDI